LTRNHQSAIRPANEAFSPLLIAGLLTRPLPPAPLEYLLRHIARRIQRNHPAILDRLQPLAGRIFLIRPTDLPYEIILTIGENQVDFSLGTETRPLPDADVVISGSLPELVDMMDGRQDGDGLFFSRSLTVTGDTEALLTLRNAVDSDEVNLEQEIFDLLGPLKNPAEKLAKAGEVIYHRLARDMTTLSRAMTGPLSTRCMRLEQQNQDMSKRLDRLDKNLAKTRSRLQSLGRKAAP